jgi:hypothetical protein
MRANRSAIIPGLFLIAIGVWLLAQNLGVSLPGLERLWPVFPLLGGLAFLIQYFGNGRRDDGLVFVGVAALLVGAFFFAFTLVPLRFDDGGLNRWWPVFILIGAAAFFAQWLANVRAWGRLVAAGLALVIGALALASTQQVFSTELVTQLLRLWPLLLILLGVITLARVLYRGKDNRTS